MHLRPFTTVELDDGRTLAVSGSIDEMVVDDFRWELQRHLVASRDAVIDLSDVDFLPSMAIGALVGALKHKRGRVTVVARHGSLAARLLTICGLPFEYRSMNGSEPHGAATAGPPPTI